MIREHGSVVEADLAFQGIDMRDLYAPGGGVSRLSPRRLLLLVRGLPHHAAIWAVLEHENGKAKTITRDQIRDRQNNYMKGAS